MEKTFTIQSCYASDQRHENNLQCKVPKIQDLLLLCKNVFRA